MPFDPAWPEGDHGQVPPSSPASGEHETTPRHERRDFALLLLGVIGALLAFYVLRAMGISEAFAGIVASVLLPVPPAVGQALAAKDPRWEHPPVGQPDRLRRSTVILALSAAALLVLHLTLDLTFALLGFAMFLAEGDINDDRTVLMLGSALIAAVPLWVATYFLLRRATRRLRRGEHAWAISVVVISGVLQLAWLLSSQHPSRIRLATISVFALLGQIGIALMAGEAGRRTRFAYSVEAHVRYLSVADRRILLKRISDGDPEGTDPPAFGSSLGGVGAGVVVTMTTFLLLWGVDFSADLASVVAGAAGLVPVILASTISRARGSQTPKRAPWREGVRSGLWL